MRWSRTLPFGMSRTAGFAIPSNLLVRDAARSNATRYAFTLNNKLQCTINNITQTLGRELNFSRCHLRVRCKWVARRNNKMCMGNSVVMRNVRFQFRRAAQRITCDVNCLLPQYFASQRKARRNSSAPRCSYHFPWARMMRSGFQASIVSMAERSSARS